MIRILNCRIPQPIFYYLMSHDLVGPAGLAAVLN